MVMDKNGIKRKWSNRTRLEKLLIISVTCLAVIVLFLFISLLSAEHDEGVCSSLECVRAATHILDTIDPSVDPCEDFYQFVCGTFLKNAFVKNQKTSLAPLLEMSRNKLRSIVTKPNNKNLTKGLKMQRQFYQSCINETAIEKDNNKSFLKLIDELGGWPVLRGYSYEEEQYSWMKIMLKASKMGLPFEFFLQVTVYDDRYKTYRNLLRITPPYVSQLLDIQYPEKKIEEISEIASIFGAETNKIHSELRKTITFAEQLHTIVEKSWKNNTEIGDPDFKITTIKMLNNKYVEMPWISFLNNLVQNITTISINDKVLFKGEDYLRDLFYLLLQTPKRIQANYIVWYLINQNKQYLTKNIRATSSKLSLLDQKEWETKRRDECYKRSRILFEYVAEAAYIRKEMNEEKKTNVKELIDNIKKQFEMTLQTSDWIDDETKNLLEKHAENMTEDIGWSSMVYDADKFEQYLQIDTLQLNSNNLMKIMQEIGRFDFKRKFSQIYKKVDDLEEHAFVTPSIEVNAYYLHYFNKLLLPAPLLQTFIFDSRRPNYMNYGSLGSMVGHEFTHGFAVPIESKFTFNDTWTSYYADEFTKKVNCLIEEYENYSGHLPGYTKNGTETVDENVADLTGQNIAYKAYQDYVKNYGHEEHLPGVKYTQNQIFWIMTGTYLCYDSKKVESNVTKYDEHSVPSFRVNGALRNSPYFAKDFSCPEGSRMNPKNKCRILV